MRKTFTAWRPFRTLRRFVRKLVDRFERAFADWNWRRGKKEDEWVLVPQVETHVAGNTLTVKANLPGIDPKAIELRVDGNHLTIKGERQADEEHREGKTYHREVRYAVFARTLTLPAEADTEKVKARYRRGGLEVTVPLVEEAAPKKVTVEVRGEAPKKLAA